MSIQTANDELELVKTYKKLTVELLGTRAGNKAWVKLYNERRRVLRDLMYCWKLTDEREASMFILNNAFTTPTGESIS
jgi:hypothetical protein